MGLYLYFLFFFLILEVSLQHTIYNQSYIKTASRTFLSFVDAITFLLGT